MKAGKKLASMLLAGSIILWSACCYAESTHQIEKQTTPIYYSDMEPENKGEVDLFFVDGVKDVPYITVETAKDILVSNVRKLDAPDYDLTVKKDGEKITLSRETYYPVTFDCEADTITFWDYDAFMTSNPNATLMDLVAVSGFNDKGEAELFQRTDTSFQLYGETITFRPGDYGIDMFYQDGEYYLPLQLFSDIILSQNNMNTLYNGENVFLLLAGNLEPFKERYYNNLLPTSRSEALADFNYNELCFALDSLYGLKQQHNIKNFDTMFQQAGIKYQLLSTDPQEAGQALWDLTFVYLDDLHSSFANRSYRMKEDPVRRYGPACMQSIADMQRYADARAKRYPNGTPGYEEIGNTAYITFDQFVVEGVDYYEEKAEDHLTDTMGLMIYSLGQIKRPNSPIKNVVLDLSNNGGGTAPSAAYTIGMFLGEGSISVTNPLTGALVCQNFKTDLNMDRLFDERDNLLDYNLFCLTSPNSFSCGNLVPSALKNSHRVTILGQTSGGGACVVQNMTTADGCVFNISGPYRLAYTKNGSFYDIDQGVTPDFVLPTPDQFYDRKQLTKYINSLLWK
ncbi:hypothetical protein D081_2370 [Anaerovibrio sp. JC8]|uniref:S41 family peptidase n=1 Tax=Anaerovibrio sp. JC8 TaxID=1240085 RepID=UPI000A0D6F2E|nr:S41 family peptidase [Anaerovibrio sp. JC8]ORT98836.1 hypothetical protein D081_2370 [Anaerovibrio sp. JC8]